MNLVFIDLFFFFFQRIIKRNALRHIIVRLLKIKNQEEILKAVKNYTKTLHIEEQIYKL